MRLNKRILRLTACITVLAFMLIAPSTALRRAQQSFITPDTSVLEIRSNRHARPESGKVAENILGTDGYEKMAENGRLELWYRKEVRGLRVRDKLSGYIWGSIPEDKVDGLNKKWSAVANAICTFEYYDAKYNTTKMSLADSGIKVTEKWSGRGADFSVNLQKQGISFEFSLRLNDDSITLELKDSSIKEKKDYMLKSVYFLPFFGAAKENEIDGYIFIPDGCGALMRFSESSSYISGYSQRVYGQDMGIDQLTQVNDLVSTRPNDYLAESGQITAPVFGVVHGAGCNAVMSVIENGEEYASINATPAGVTTDYSWVTAVFDYRRMYTHTVDKNTGVYRPQAEKNTVNPRITLYFLSGEEASYSGMAVRYRGLLEADGLLPRSSGDSGDIPLGLYVIGAEIADGTLFDYTRTLTDLSQAYDFVERINSDGIADITMVFDGWQKKGINGSDYGTVRFQGSVGTQSDFSGLADKLKSSGGKFYLASNITTANERQISTQKQAALQISKQFAVFSRSNPSAMFANYYVLKVKELFKTIEKYSEKLADFDFYYGQIGYRLYSDYTTNAEYSRSAFAEGITERLASSEQQISLSNPNMYCWKYTSDYFDMPMNNSQYLYETDTVPFLQIVLKGSVDYYAPFANQSGYSSSDILKMIEFGAYPSFIVAHADNYSLQDTPLVDYFSINFDDWYPTLKEVYKEVSSALGRTEGSRITAHTVISEGVVRTDYDNGVSIYVNYMSRDYNTGELTIPASGYLLTEGGAVNEK